MKLKYEGPDIGAVIDTYEDLNKIALHITKYLTGKISKEDLMRVVSECTLHAPPVRRDILPELAELMKELYDLIDNEAWAHVADHMQEIQNYIVQKVGENDIFE